tara:strand:- start:45 stop:227 length:183 start_codon:yes stop_codon:yes gene_type:complete
MGNKIVKFKEAIQDIDFSHISNRNHFSCDELNEIICFKIDLLFKQHFPKTSENIGKLKKA